MASRNEEMIRRQLSDKGYEVHEVKYVQDRGWHIKTDDGPVTGYNIDELLEEIKYLPKLN